MVIDCSQVCGEEQLHHQYTKYLIPGKTFEVRNVCRERDSGGPWVFSVMCSLTRTFLHRHDFRSPCWRARASTLAGSHETGTATTNSVSLTIALRGPTANCVRTTREMQTIENAFIPCTYVPDPNDDDDNDVTMVVMVVVVVVLSGWHDNFKCQK